MYKLNTWGKLYTLSKLNTWNKYDILNTCIYISLQISVFLSNFLYVYPLPKDCWVQIDIAKSTAAVINVNFLLLYLIINPMLKEIWYISNRIKVHKYIIGVILFTSFIHTGAHLYNYYFISKWKYLITTPAGITGIILYVAFIMIMISILMKNYDIFIYFHNLNVYLVIPIALILHGSFCFIKNEDFTCNSSNSLKYIAVPYGLLILYKCKFYYYSFQSTKTIHYAMYSKNILELTCKKDNFMFYPGEHVYIFCPKVSYTQWHPFTIASNPLDYNIFKLYIKRKGKWTDKFIEYVLNTEGRYYQPKIYISQSLGINYQQDLIQYKTLIIFANGVGITPFISLLKLCMNSIHEYVDKRIVLHWTCRDPQDFNIFLSDLNKYEQEKHHYININLYITGPDKNFNCKPLIFYTSRPQLDNVFYELDEIYAKDQLKVLFCCSKSMAKDVVKNCKKYNFNYSQGDFSI